MFVLSYKFSNVFIFLTERHFVNGEKINEVITITSTS